MEKNQLDNSKKYYIGLDIGTDSVGWAVTDENYNLMRKKGRDLWGSYLFDEAKTSAETRGFRTARRRLSRRKHRIKLLQELFAEEIAKVDMGFFARLENSKYFLEDKVDRKTNEKINTLNVLFDDKSFSDKDYFKKFPTIFHLRKYLIGNEIKDVRFLYLAIHHVIKNRGHFLYEQDFDLSNTSNVSSDFAFVRDYFSDNEMSTFSKEVFNEIFEIMCDKSRNNSDKQKSILALTHASREKHLIAFSKALVGNQFSLSDLFNTDEFEDKAKLKFNDANYDQKFQELSSALGDERANVLISLKRIYDFAYLRFILGDSEYLSEAKVKSFEEHRDDLLKLKEYVRKNCPEKYKLVFRRQEKGVCNYAKYIGMDRQKGFSKCSKEDFYDFLKKEVKVDDSDILSKIDKGTFLQKQISGENCVIPYQVHLHELKAILQNAEKYFPFLSEESDGMTVSDKIISFMTFRVPYYVGPFYCVDSTSNEKRKNSWMIKKEGVSLNEKITPWNFDKVVDKDASEKEFIRRMTNKCTYLVGEDVLPACSLLWSEFLLLNELNSLKINGERSLTAKKVLFDYAKNEKKLTLKKCLAELKRKGLVSEDSKANEVFSGSDGDLKSSLSSYIDMKRIMGDLVDENREMCEEIIKWITIVSDKNRLEKMIKQKYGHILSLDMIKSLKGLNYAKWGRFSRTLLEEIVEIDSNGEYGTKSIIDAMREGIENFMELLSNKYGYSNAISVFNDGINPSSKVTYKTVEELSCSPAVKRGIWNSVKLVKEIMEIENAKPQKVFIEMTRQNDTTTPKDKRRTKSRKQKLQELYDSLNVGDWKELCGDENAKAKWRELLDNFDERKLQGAKDKLYLWFTQLGRDVYTGEVIELENVLNPELYDVDHIYPQSKIKDDSINNRVLVSKHFNQNVKKDVYPLPYETRSKMLGFWKLLKNKKFISEEKFERLTRSTALTLDECADFIDRQLVFTNLTTKAVADILKKLIGSDCEIVYSKACNVTDFRRQFQLTKLRELNDLHHAKDAYLNVVVGNVYNVKFNHNAKAYFRKNGLENYNLNRLYAENTPKAWKVGDEGRIKGIYERNTAKVTRQTLEGKGKLFNATIEPAKADLIPLKVNDPLSNTEKYGGYNSATTAYFMLVKSEGKKGKTMLSFESVTVLDALNFKTKEDKKKYCEEKLGLKNPKIIVDCIKLKTLLNVDGSYAWLSGRTGDRMVLCNANQFFIDNVYVRYLKQLSRYQKEVKKTRTPLLPVSENITKDKNLELYDVFVNMLNDEKYNGFSNMQNQSIALLGKRGCFEGLTDQEQCNVLMQIFNLFQCNRVLSDLKLLGLGGTVGSLLLSKDVAGKNIKIITQSMTGFYRNVIDVQEELKKLS